MHTDGGGWTVCIYDPYMHMLITVKYNKKARRGVSRGLSSHPVGMENSPMKQKYFPWRRTLRGVPFMTTS